MEENRLKIEELERKLHELISRQQSFLQECTSIQAEINQLKNASSPVKNDVAASTINTEKLSAPVSPIAVSTPKQTTQERKPQQHSKSNLEKFVGENLINKIGIIITILGVGWGVKYSIDNQLISPATRMILGYLFSSGLLGLSFYLKKKYENYSAVLLSGSMAMMYFITYFSHSTYGLIGQLTAFALMVVFTLFTVAAALQYNRSVIAHIGLVGAYAVPFLLSDGSGKVHILFSYMTIINVGILVIAFKRYWKSLYYSSFGFTWIIVAGWAMSTYKMSDTLITYGIVFSTIFFLLFYTAMLAYKVYRKEPYVLSDTIMMIANALIYYSIGHFVLLENQNEQFVFACFNLLVNASIGFYLLKRRDIDSKIAHHVFGLAVFFLTIALPIKLNHEWLTVVWALEAAALIWIASRIGVGVYQNSFSVVFYFAFISLIFNWEKAYSVGRWGEAANIFTPLANTHFLLSLFVAAVMVFVCYIIYVQPQKLTEVKPNVLSIISKAAAPIVALIVLFNGINEEVCHYWTQLFRHHVDATDFSLLQYFNETVLLDFQRVWISNYTVAFVAALLWFARYKIHQSMAHIVSYMLCYVGILFFLPFGLYHLSELREYYLLQKANALPADSWMIMIRYGSLALIAFLLWSMYRFIKQATSDLPYEMLFDFGLHISILWIASSELLHWMDMTGYQDSYKTGISILWGVYSLFLVVLGIWKGKSYLRIAAMVWFGITLIKLFLYDLSGLSTISKTIVLVILGVVLLIISFLYNKHKTKIFGDEG